MALQNYFGKEWRPVSAPATNAEISNGCFDCNICLDFANEPIVTLCGHLYCWPCIYKWLHVQSASLATDEHPQCPVCKADISHTAMVPLYGRGQSNSEGPEGKAFQLGMPIPPRPSACGAQAITTAPRTGQQLPYRNPYQSHSYSPQQFGVYEEDSPSSLPGSHHHPVVGMFGGMVYARVFGNSESVAAAYPNSSYRLMSSSSPRLRRQEMQAEKSLNRISIFLLCCFLLCLIVF